MAFRFKIFRIDAIFIHSTTNGYRHLMKSSRAACMETFRFKIFRMSVIFVHSTTNGDKKLYGLKIFRIKRLSSAMVDNLFSMLYTVYL